MAAASLAVAAGCRDPRAARNPFPEGRDTVGLRPLGAVTRHGDTTRILAFDVSPVGVVAVASESGVVSIHDSSGVSYVRIAGAQGQAPAVSGVGVLADGRVAVRESTSGRVSVHRTDGQEEASWTVSPGRPPHGREALLVEADGTLLFGIRPELGPDAPPVSFPRPVFVRTTVSGEVLDTTWVGPEVTTECPTLSEGHFRAGWFEDIRVRYVPKALWAAGPDGTFVFGCPARYEFTVRRPGASDRTVSRSWRPHAVSGRERSDFMALWTVQMNASGARQGWQWRGPPLPETRPAYQRILVADGGRVWVWPAQPSHQEPAPPDWPVAGLPAVLWTEATTGAFDVFGADGRLLGHVRLPSNLPYAPQPNTADPVIRGDTIWAVTVDESRSYAVERFLVAWGP
jgi:hypothetical protein